MGTDQAREAWGVAEGRCAGRVGLVSCLRQSNGETSERRTPMRPAAGRVLMGLAVVVMISSGVGQWAAVAGGKMYWTDLGTARSNA